jgi:hypothetical protein
VASKAYKLLKRMRQSPKSWKPAELRSLYEGFGFIISHGGSHDTVKHPDFPHVRALRDTIPRGDDELSPAYIRDAIKRIELLEVLRKESEIKNE